MRCRQCHMPVSGSTEIACPTCGGRCFPAEPEGADSDRLESRLQNWWLRLAADGPDPVLAANALQLYALQAMRAPDAAGSDPGDAIGVLDPADALALIYLAVQSRRADPAARWLLAVAEREPVGLVGPESRRLRFRQHVDFSLSRDETGLRLAARFLPQGEPRHVLSVNSEGVVQVPTALPPLLPEDRVDWSREIQMEAAAAFVMWKAVAAPGTPSLEAVDAFAREEWQHLQQRLDAVRDRMPVPALVSELHQHAADRHRGFFRALQPERWMEDLEKSALQDLEETVHAMRREWEAAVEASLAAWLDEQLADIGRGGTESMAEGARTAIASVQSHLDKLLRTGERLLERSRTSLTEGLTEAAKRSAGLAWTLGRVGRLDEPAEQAALFVERFREVHVLRVIRSSVGWLGGAMRRHLDDAAAAVARREAQIVALRQGTERALKEMAHWEPAAAQTCRRSVQQLENEWFSRHRRDIWKIAAPLAVGARDGGRMLADAVRLLEPSWGGGGETEPEALLCKIRA